MTCFLKRKSLLCLSLIVICSLIITPISVVKSDGCFIPAYYPEHRDIYEPSQTALIVHDNNQEDLYLKVNYSGNVNSFVWLIPTPTYPDSSEAPKDIFEELSIYTKKYDVIPEGRSLLKTGSYDGVEQNVVVHEQKHIGIYEITVLSAAGADGLLDWLNENNYPVKEDVKTILDWYVQKEWYFTAVRIDLEYVLNEIISDYKKIDESITKENLAAKLAQYYIDSFQEKDFNKFKNAFGFIQRLSFDGLSSVDINDINEDEFNSLINDNYAEIEKEMFSLQFIDSVISDLQFEIDKFDLTKITNYSNFISPIKISFSSNVVVYPLKISQISTRVPTNPEESTKTNEILLYVLADEQVKAPGFELEYADIVNLKTLQDKEIEMYSETDLNSLKDIIGEKEYFLTKLRRDFARVEMDEDLYLINGEDTDVNNDQFNIYLFWGKSCPHCDKEKIFLEELENEYKEIKVDFPDYIDFKIYDYEIYNNSSNLELFKTVTGKLNVNSQGVPFLVIGDEYVLGYSPDGSTDKQIQEKVEYCLINQCVDLMNDIEISSVSLTQSYEQNDKYQQAKNKIKGTALADRLRGKIVLKVEDDGKAYYINPATHYAYYLGRPADAFSIMRKQGTGITNANLKKIPIGISELSGVDSDNDGLSDLFEDAIGTDKNNTDTDGDGYNDRNELNIGYSPISTTAKMVYDTNFADKQKGKIFLQIEGNGEAWYVNPVDGKRYFLGRPADAFNVMRNLGLGISNEDFEELK